MKKLIALAKKKPHWMANEGYWRILQILRVLASVPLALIGIGCLAAAVVEMADGGYGADDLFGVGLLFLALSVAAFVAVHAIAWAVVWVRAGFSEAKLKLEN